MGTISSSMLQSSQVARPVQATPRRSQRLQVILQLRFGACALLILFINAYASGSLRRFSCMCM